MRICTLTTQRSSRCTGWMIYRLLEKGSDGSASLHSFDMLQVLGPRSAGAGWVRFHEHNWLNPARQPPARILQEDASRANFSAWKQSTKHKSEPQLCDRLSPFHGVRLQPLGEVAVTGCWAHHLRHRLKNTRLLLVEPMVLQRLAAHGSTASVTLWWEPHLQLVKVENKIEGTVLSVCSSLVPAEPAGQHQPSRRLVRRPQRR